MKGLKKRQAEKRQSYHKRKAAKKFFPISEMSASDGKKIRKRNRDNFRAYYHRKKQQHGLDIPLEENSFSDLDEENAESVKVNICILLEHFGGAKFFYSLPVIFLYHSMTHCSSVRLPKITYNQDDIAGHKENGSRRQTPMTNNCNRNC